MGDIEQIKSMCPYTADHCKCLYCRTAAALVLADKLADAVCADVEQNDTVIGNCADAYYDARATTE